MDFRPRTTPTAEPAPVRRKWRNPWKRLPQIRWAVQGTYALFLCLVGYEFWTFFRQALGGGEVTATRPPSVEAFLPISALVGLKRLLVTGMWDEVHPAGLTILLAAIAASLVARKSFCSWVCPVGTMSRGLEWLGGKVLWRGRRKEVLVPGWLDKTLGVLKYATLAFFTWAILVKMGPEMATAFMHSPFNYAADAKMLLFFVDISGTAALVMAVLAVLSIVIKNFWCRFLCPYGALLGVFSWLSPQRVIRDPATCIDCRLCTKSCPVELEVHGKKAVWSPECTGCLNCVAVCPVKDCLTVGRKAEKGWSPYLIPVLGVGTLLAAWVVAVATGHWHTSIPARMLIAIYRHAPLLGL